jgi:hypothetical protein
MIAAVQLGYHLAKVEALLKSRLAPGRRVFPHVRKVKAEPYHVLKIPPVLAAHLLNFPHQDCLDVQLGTVPSIGFLFSSNH